jgi:hypothetical protein
MVDDLGRIAEVKIEKHSPDDPHGREENIGIRKRAFSELIRCAGEATRRHTGIRELPAAIGG